jgi:hypothetical protein
MQKLEKAGGDSRFFTWAVDFELVRQVCFPSATIDSSLALLYTLKKKERKCAHELSSSTKLFACSSVSPSIPAVETILSVLGPIKQTSNNKRHTWRIK